MSLSSVATGTADQTRPQFDGLQTGRAVRPRILTTYGEKADPGWLSRVEVSLGRREEAEGRWGRPELASFPNGLRCHEGSFTPAGNTAF
jgi:hypothetical protein